VLKINGEPIITAKDAIRLSSTNTAIPAFEIPMRWSKFVLPMTDELLMEMNTDSRMIVKSSSLLDCLKSGVLEQTGLELNSEDLSEAFGLTEAISTNAYPQIVVSSGQIIANGNGSFPEKLLKKMVQFKSLETGMLIW